MDHPQRQYMERAIELAHEGRRVSGSAIGALVVQEDRIVAEAFTTIKRDQDPTAHAEINAIRAAARKVGSLFLEACYLYTTYEPCPMCTSAAIWAKLSGIVYGAGREDRTPQYPWRVEIPAAEVIERSTPRLILHERFMREECRPLLHL